MAAGFRKENLQRGTWLDIRKGEVLICRCHATFLEDRGYLHVINFNYDDVRS